MARAMDIFADAYLKKLKRPELQRNYDPDQSYGANMLFRSEETNPWAGRDQSNAKFGYLGGPQGYKSQVPSLSPQGGAEAASGMMPGGWNLPMMPSKQKETFSNLMAPVSAVGGKWGADAIMNWMKSGAKDLTGAGEVLNKADLAEALSGGMGAPDLTGAGEALRGADLAGAGAERLGEGLSFAAPDPTSMAAAGIPMLARMFGLKGTAGDALGAATSTGLAAAQGFMNPVSDVGALWSLFKLFGGLF